MKHVPRLLFFSALLPVLATALISQCVAQNTAIAAPDIVIRISSPGISAETMHTTVSEPARALFQDMKDLDAVSTASSDGVSLIMLRQNTVQKDQQILLREIRSRLEIIQQRRPGVEAPRIELQKKRTHNAGIRFT